MSARIIVFAAIVLSLITLSGHVAGLPQNNGNAAASSFRDIDISRTPGLGDAAKAAADTTCNPAQLSAEELTNRNELAETAETSLFNPQIAAAEENNAALAAALECQKIKNKVLKNTCQFQAAVLENNQGQIDENTRQIAANINSTNNLCANVDESLFVDVSA